MAVIFSDMGKAIAKTANKLFSQPLILNVKVVVVANPANTNCLITALNAENIPKKNFSALTRLDYNRAKGQLHERFKLTSPNHIKNVIIWGNHSKTMFPDVIDAKVLRNGKWEAVSSVLSEEDKKWLENDFITTVQQRGSSVIKARGLSSAMSAANAAVDHIHNLFLGTKEGHHVAMAVWSDGNPYGIEDGIFYSFPVKCKNGEWQFVDGIKNNTSRGKELMKITEQELLEEKRIALGSTE
eukprot:jgi/Bigna1/91778/estExt_fgenesh1_pg.C_1180033